MRTVPVSSIQPLVSVLMALELCLSVSWILPTGTLWTSTLLENTLRSPMPFIARCSSESIFLINQELTKL